MTDSAQNNDSDCTDKASAKVVISTRELESSEVRSRWIDTLDSTYCELDVDWPDISDSFGAELSVGTAARSGDRFGHAACVAGVVMMVSNSTGVNLPSRS